MSTYIGLSFLWSLFAMCNVLITCSEDKIHRVFANGVIHFIVPWLCILAYVARWSSDQTRPKSFDVFDVLSTGQMN